jgi:hypothetical protein
MGVWPFRVETTVYLRMYGSVSYAFRVETAAAYMILKGSELTKVQLYLRICDFTRILPFRT